MASRIDDTAIAFATDDSIGALHLGSDIDLAYCTCAVGTTVLDGDIAECACGRHVADRIARGMAEHVVCHRNECIFLAEHLAILADDG